MPAITMPKLSDTMTEGTVAKWLKNPGDKIEMGDILAEIETDKATMEMEAFDEGTLKEILVEEGQSAKVGAKIAFVDGEEDDEEPEETKPATKETAPANDAKSEPTSVAPAKSDVRVKASPLAKKIASERGVDLSGVTGSGPGGRIVAADVPEAGNTSAPSVKPSAPAPAAIKLEATGGDEQKVSLSGMRRIIAERLLASKTQIPHFYLSIEVDAAPLMRLRKEVNAANEVGKLPKITVNDFILLATARAAALNPKVNAAWAGDHILQYGSVNLSVAVAVDDGLVTPVLRNAQNLSLRQISEAVKELAGRARNKKLKPEEFQGGTITVSNLGSYGVEQFYAIINPPQAAILAVGAIVKKPVVNAKDEIVVGQRMNISLSGDHRVVDGAVGAEFMSSLRKLVENPALMLF